jgi:glycosyltransferase involved in cell wall biosynthesis
LPSALFWYGAGGGTAHYRAFNPGRALSRLGWDVEFAGKGIYVSDSGRVKGDPDVLVCVRAMGENVPPMLRRIRDRGDTTIVYDVDDWFLGVPDYNPASKMPAADVASMHDAMRLAHLVTCSTPELAEGYASLNRTVVLANYLDPDLWDWDDNRKYVVDHDKVHVGWMGFFNWRAKDLELLKPWVQPFLADHPEVRFAAIGCPELLGYLGVGGVTTPSGNGLDPLNPHGRPYEHLPAMLGALDIGLVPLAYNRFNQSKSWCKGLEYNAMGIPVVASASREYRSFVRPGVNGLLVRHNNWTQQVSAVLDDLDNYRDGARKVAAEYMIDDHIHRWVEAYESCTRRS